MLENVGLPPIPFDLSDASANEDAAIRAEFAEIATAHADHKVRVEEVKSVKEWSPELNQRTGALRANELTVAQRASVALTRVDKHFTTVVAHDQPAAKEAARLALEATKTRVRQSLVAAGFVDGPMDEMNGRRGIGNDWVSHHPEVIAAGRKFQSISDFDLRHVRAKIGQVNEALKSRIGHALVSETSAIR